MKLSRWAKNGSTRSVWLLREHPGVIVERFRGGWVVRLIVPQKPTEWSLRVWGEKWSVAPASVRSVAYMKQSYRTRGEALLAFEAGLGASSSSLSEML